MSLVPFLWGYFSKVAKLRVAWQQETSQKLPTWASALFKALFSMSSVYATNAASCLLSRLLSIFRETKPEATGRLCLLLPRKKYQLVLHSCVFTHSLHFRVCSPGTSWEKASGKYRFVPLKRVWNIAMKTVIFFIFLAASFIFIFNMAKSFYRNHSVTGKGERGVRLKCNPSRWMLPSQMLFPFLPILFSFDIAGRLFS